MNRKMWPIEVEVDDHGFIHISQERGTFEDNDCIIIHPDQVDLLFQWIQDARNELQK